MYSKKTESYLKEHHANYEIVEHTPAYTAQELAAISHTKGKDLAKTVILKVDGKLIMLVEPANVRVNLEELKKLMNAKKIELANEYEFQNKFLDCETGAMPPFGDLFHMDVYMSESLKNRREIAFNGGSHSEMLKMTCRNFIELVKPNFIAI